MVRTRRAEVIGHDVDRAAGLIQTGGLVAFATETVYGLGANALDSRAVARIFEAKQRPLFDPLICHVAHIDQLSHLTDTVSPTVRSLVDQFWPGPLSIILPKTSQVPSLVSSGLETVAVRMPDHPLALELIQRAQTPVAAPSANLFGQVSPTTAEHVAEQLGDDVDYILDGGACRVGLESTVIRPIEATGSAQPVVQVLRPGGVTYEQLQAAGFEVQTVEARQHPVYEAASSPGMLERHYSPRTPLSLIDQHSVDWPTGPFGLLTPQPVPHLPAEAVAEVLSPTGDLTECAAEFFAALRRLDSLQLPRILAIEFENEGLGRALNDRLRRAAAR